MKESYIFTSERLGFRNWKLDDLDAFAELTADEEVMKHFPSIMSRDETKDLIVRFQKHFEKKNYTYYAVEIKSSGEFIGFIGLAYQEYEASFLPATDIGWRLKRSSWGNGYATEGAKKCLAHAFSNLGIETIVAVCTERNINSENVMKKIGMTKQGYFNHPKLKDYPEHERCMWYETTKN